MRSRDVSDVTVMRAWPTAVAAAASSWLLLPGASLVMRSIKELKHHVHIRIVRTEVQEIEWGGWRGRAH